MPWASLVLLGLLLPACSGLHQGVVEGRVWSRERPVLVMRAVDAVQEDGTVVERSGAVLSASLRARLDALGFAAVAGQSRTRSEALVEAEALQCGSVASLVVTDWSDSVRDWVAHPDVLGLSMTAWSVDDGLPVAHGAEVVELKNMNVVHGTPFDLAGPLLERLLDAILTGRIDASDVPGS